MLKQLGAALTALWIGCVPAALADKVVTQPPCAFCLTFTSETPNSVIDNFKQTLRLSALVEACPRCEAIVTAHGSLTCTYVLSQPLPAIIDLAAQIVQENEPVDVGSGPGRVVLFAQLPAHGATTFNLASTRTFKVVGAPNFGGLFIERDFHLRLQRNSLSPNTHCDLRHVELTVHFIN
jgi:hypothetical protein